MTGNSDLGFRVQCRRRSPLPRTERIMSLDRRSFLSASADGPGGRGGEERTAVEGHDALRAGEGRATPALYPETEIGVPRHLRPLWLNNPPFEIGRASCSERG